MFLLREPSPEQIHDFVSAQRELPFSYSEVGASRENPPRGYTLDHNRIKIGRGRQSYQLALEALRNWKQFDLGWVKIVPDKTRLEVGATVAIKVQTFGVWSLNACRIVYLIDEDGPVKKFGFAYGTLPDHAERGEERFQVEWDREEDFVWYDILAFSQPKKLLVKLARPLTRRLQKRFARDSLRKMVQAASFQPPDAAQNG